MKQVAFRWMVAGAATEIVLAALMPVLSGGNLAAGSAQGEQIVTEKASGEFDLNLRPAAGSGETMDGFTVSRMGEHFYEFGYFLPETPRTR